jgi:hypothetical protein
MVWPLHLPISNPDCSKVKRTEDIAWTVFFSGRRGYVFSMYVCHSDSSLHNCEETDGFALCEVHSVPTFPPQFIRPRRSPGPKPMSVNSPDSYLDRFSPPPVPRPRRVWRTAPPIQPGESRSIFPSFPRRKVVTPRRNSHEIQHIASPIPSKDEMAHVFRYAKVRSPRNTVPRYVAPKVSDHELTLQPAMPHG